MTANYKNSRPRVRVYFRKQVASWQGGNKKKSWKIWKYEKNFVPLQHIRAENQDRLEFVTYLK